MGWAKRGPTGVLGSNKRDARETVGNLLADLSCGDGTATRDPDAIAVDRLLRDRGVAVVDADGWRAIDAHERAVGARTGRPRVKLTQRETLLGVAHGRRSEMVNQPFDAVDAPGQDQPARPSV